MFPMLLSMGMLVVFNLIPLALAGMVVSYLALRMKPVTPPDEADNQVGLKSALYMIYSIGILMVLIGMTQLVVDLITQAEWFTKSMDRLGKYGAYHRQIYAMMLSGFVFAFFHLLLILGYTNNYRQPAVSKFWIGWRFAIASLVVLSTTTMLIFTCIISDSPPEKAIQAELGVLIVWIPSWLLHLVFLSPPRPVKAKRNRGDDDEEEKPVRPTTPTPQRPTTPGQQQSQQVPVQRPTQQRPGQVRPTPRKPGEE